MGYCEEKQISSNFTLVVKEMSKKFTLTKNWLTNFKLRFWSNRTLKFCGKTQRNLCCAVSWSANAPTSPRYHSRSLPRTHLKFFYSICACIIVSFTSVLGWWTNAQCSACQLHLVPPFLGGNRGVQSLGWAASFPLDIMPWTFFKWIYGLLPVVIISEVDMQVWMSRDAEQLIIK